MSGIMQGFMASIVGYNPMTTVEINLDPENVPGDRNVSLINSHEDMLYGYTGYAGSSVQYSQYTLGTNEYVQGFPATDNSCARGFKVPAGRYVSRFNVKFVTSGTTEQYSGVGGIVGFSNYTLQNTYVYNYTYGVTNNNISYGYHLSNGGSAGYPGSGFMKLNGSSAATILDSTNTYRMNRNIFEITWTYDRITSRYKYDLLVNGAYGYNVTEETYTEMKLPYARSIIFAILEGGRWFTGDTIRLKKVYIETKLIP